MLAWHEEGNFHLLYAAESLFRSQKNSSACNETLLLNESQKWRDGWIQTDRKVDEWIYIHTYVDGKYRLPKIQTGGWIDR